MRRCSLYKTGFLCFTLAVGISAARASTISENVVAAGTCSNTASQGCVALSSYLTGDAAGKPIYTLNFNSESTATQNNVAFYTGTYGFDIGTAPQGDTSNFFSLNTANSTNTVSADIIFNQNINYFGLYWGSPSSQDEIVFFNGSTAVQTFTGASLTSSSANPQGDAYVSFNIPTSMGIDAIGLISTQCCFESDNQSYVLASSSSSVLAPEPGTVGMMSLALGLWLSYHHWRRRSRFIPIRQESHYSPAKNH